MLSLVIYAFAVLLGTLLLYGVIHHLDIMPHARCYEKTVDGAIRLLRKKPSAWLMLIVHAWVVADLLLRGRFAYAPLLVVLGAVGLSDWLTRYVPSFRLSSALAVLCGVSMWHFDPLLKEPVLFFDKAIGAFFLVLFVALVTWIGIERRGHLGDAISFAPFALIPSSIFDAFIYILLWVFLALLHGIWQWLSGRSWMYPDACARWHAALLFAIVFR